MFPWGRRASTSQAAGGTGGAGGGRGGGDSMHLSQQDHDSAYINNHYDEDDILGAMKEIHSHHHHHHNHSLQKRNTISSFHPANTSRYNISQNTTSNDGQSESGQQHNPSNRSNRSSQRYSHLQNNNNGHFYGHQQQDSVQSMQQFYHLHEYRRSEDHSSIRYYMTGEYHLDLTSSSGEGGRGGRELVQEQYQQGVYGYRQSDPRTPDRKVVNRTSFDQMDLESDAQFSPPPSPHRPYSSVSSPATPQVLATTPTMVVGAGVEAETEVEAGVGVGTGISPTQQRTITNVSTNNNEGGDNNHININSLATTTITNKTLAKLSKQARHHHTYSGFLASSTTSSISSSSSSPSSSTVVSTTISPVHFSPPSPPPSSARTPQTPRLRMSYPAAVTTTSYSTLLSPSLVSTPSTPGAGGNGSDSTATIVDTITTCLRTSTGTMESPTTSTATASPTTTIATTASADKLASSPSSSLTASSPPSTLNNNNHSRHHNNHRSLHSLTGGGSSPSSSSSSPSTMKMKMKAFEVGVDFETKPSSHTTTTPSPPSPSYPSSPSGISNSPSRPLSFQQYQQQYQVSRPLTAHLNASLSAGGGGGGRRSLLAENSYSYSYPKGDTDWQGNLTLPSIAATNAAAGDNGGGEAIPVGGESVRGGATTRGNGGNGDEGMLECAGMLNAEDDDDDDDEDTGPEPCYVFSVPDWETIKAGLLPTSKPARDALMATIVLALITIALEAVLLHRHRVMTANLTGLSAPNSEGGGSGKGGGGMSYEISYFRPLTVYYFIFILAEVFAVGLLWDAAIHKNSLQLVAFTLFEWCMVSYSGLQIWQHDQLVKEIEVPAEVLIDLDDKTTQMILFSQLGVQIAACLGITLLTWRLYSEFGWLVFQKLGADVSLRKMMKEYRLLFTLLKLDAFFFFGYAIQVAALTDKHWQKGLEEIAFAIPLSGIIILLGFCALRNENKVTMGGFISCLGLLIAYMMYRLVALYQTLTGDASTDPYFFSRKTMTVFAALTLFMTVLALVYAIVMLYNFNKGLKEAMQQYRVRRSGTIRSVTPSTRRASVNRGGGGSYKTSAGGSSGGGGGNSNHGSAVGLGGSGDVNHAGAGGRRMSSHQSNGGMNGMVGLGPGFSGGIGTSGGGGGGGGGGRRSSKRVSRRSLLHCELTGVVPTMVERWSIE